MDRIADSQFAGDKCPSMLMLEARGICEGATGRNGGQLRPHLYSRYTPWSQRFGPQVAHDLIAHEYAHFNAFAQVFESEGISADVAFKLGETFDAAMSQEAWDRLKGNYEHMKRDHGENDYIVKSCRLIEDPKEAEAFTQMKGTVGAVVHPTGQVYVFRIARSTWHAVNGQACGKEAGSPAEDRARRQSVDKQVAIQIRTRAAPHRARLRQAQPASQHARARGVGARLGGVHHRDDGSGRGAHEACHPCYGESAIKMLHLFCAGNHQAQMADGQNRWAGHLLDEFKDLIIGGRGTLAAIKAPEGFIKHSGAQHWDPIVNVRHASFAYLPPCRVFD